ncbi:MAG: cell wall anchor protein [Daejeonella sp.]|nr:cell wall anchor protein [Daejeonella sp.]
MRSISTLIVILISAASLHAQSTLTRNDAGLRGDQGANSGFFETSAPVNYPAGAVGWWHLLDVRHSNPSNNLAMQFSGSFYDQNLYFRKTSNNPAQPWSRLLTNTGNVSSLGGQYQVIDIGDNGIGDYARSLILLHEMYNTTLLSMNYAVGTVTAMRGHSGAGNRLNVVTINTSSAYNGTFGSLQSFDADAAWKLKTCIYEWQEVSCIRYPLLGSLP